MNTEAGADNCNGTNQSQVSLLSVEFKKKYIGVIDEEIASLKSKIADLSSESNAWKEKMKIRLAKIKETKKKVNDARTEVKELKKTRENVIRSLKHVTEYSELLQSDLNKYRGDNIILEKEHKESIDDMENKWKIYQAQYETLPLAVERTKAKNKLNRDKVELMVKQYELKELEEAKAKKKEIDIMLRNSLVVKCAELFKEAKLEDLQLRRTLATRKSLEEEIIKQEKMIAELTEKQSQESAAAPVDKSNEKKFPLFTAPHRRPQLIRRFDLTFPVETLTQPMPTFRKDDFDTISITSSVIDNLMELEILEETEANDDDQTVDAAVFDTRNKAFNVENDHHTPSNDRIASNPIIEDEKESSQRLEAESAVDEHVEMQEMEECDFLDRPNEDKEEPEHSLICSETPKKKHGRDFLAGSNPPPQQQPQLELGETERKKPRIMNVEKVIQPNIIRDKKPLREDSLARYFAASRESSVDYNWKDVDCSSSIFGFKDSQKGNAEFESILDSEMSMQSEDMMKKFHISFASDREDKEEYESKTGDNQKQFITPQTGLPGPSQIGRVKAAATPFINMVNIETPNNRGEKKKPFFLEMF